MGGLELALAVEEHVEGEDGEAQAIAELLDKQAGGNHDEVGVERVAQENVDCIGQRDRHDHGPQPLLHAVAAHQDASDDATQEETDESDGAIGEAIFLGRESQSALRVGAEDESLGHGVEQGLGESIEQEEEHDADGFLDGELLEERAEHVLQLVSHFAHAPFGLHIIGRTRHEAAVIEPQRDEDACQAIEYQRPREAYLVAEHYLQDACQRNENAVDEDDGKPVEGVAQAHILGLVVPVELYHVESVGRDVVCGAAEGDEEEEAHRGLKPECRGDGEGDARQGCSDERLHGEHPPALGLQQVDERTPQGFDDPGQGQPACVEAHLGVGESHLHVHYDRKTRDDDVGQSFCKI